MSRQTGKVKARRVMTAAVGSYPKPEYLFPGSGRELLDEVGMSFRRLEEEIGAAEFAKRLDAAALMAIRDHDEAGIDLITDGEERRGHYVLDILRGLGGVSFARLQRRPIREGHYVRDLPVVTGRIAYKGPILVNEYRFARAHASGIVKIGLPGPSTVVDSVADEYYEGDREQMAMDYAHAIRREVESLLQAGCRVIQFDDPVLLRYPQQTRQWGLEALQTCFAGLEEQASFVVHVCRGYPDEALDREGVAYKADAANYADLLGWLSGTTIDIISIEGAPGRAGGQMVHPELDLSILPLAGTKTVMLGVVDVGSDRVEDVESLVERGREALRYLPSQRLILAPNCGMVQLSREAARSKLANITSAAAALNGSQ